MAPDKTRIPKWASTTLAIQIALALLCPPLVIKGRHFFLSDFWIMGWVAIAFAQGAAPARHRKEAWAWAALIALVYVHGFWRIPLIEAFRRVELNMLESDAFNPVRELFIAVRFLSWILAARLVSAWASLGLPMSWTSKQEKTLAACLILAGTAAAAAGASPSVAHLIGWVYHYDPDSLPWQGRVYGLFRSPLDASLTFCMGSLLIACAHNLSKRIKLLAYFSSTLGAGLSKSATPPAATLLSIAAGAFPRIGRRQRLVVVLLGLLLITGFIGLREQSPWISSKIANLTYRLMPWKIFLQTLAERWDYLLLGAGFTHFFTDNIYLFVGYRAGLLGLTVFAVTLIRWLGQGWHRWSPRQLGLALFLPIAGLSLDSFIARPLVALWIGLALPLLSMRPGRPPSPKPSSG